MNEFERLKKALEDEGRMRERAVEGEIIYQRRLEDAERRLEDAEQEMDDLKDTIGRTLGYRQEIIDRVMAGEHLEFITRDDITMVFAMMEAAAKLGDHQLKTGMSIAMNQIWKA